MVQLAVHSPMMERRDVLALAPTGSGKTLAFGVPLLAQLLLQPPVRHKAGRGVRFVNSHDRLRAVVLSPTRELAQQVAGDLAQAASGTVLRIGAVFGKSALGPQREMVASGLDILVGTPGRLLELLDLGALTLARVACVVVDEADRMMDMGFMPQVERVMGWVPTDRQVVCLSATLPAATESRVLQLLRNPARVDVGLRNAPAHRRHVRCDVADDDKSALLVALIREQNMKGVVVYVRTRRRAGWVTQALRRHKISVDVLHGDRSQRARNEALAAFAGGTVDCLVATDVAARGLHVPRIKSVVNYDVPLMPEDFVHRVGRAGHGGGEAESFTFVDRDEFGAWRAIGALSGVETTAFTLPDFTPYQRAGGSRVQRRTNKAKVDFGGGAPRLRGGVGTKPLHWERANDGRSKGGAAKFSAKKKRQRSAPITLGQKSGSGVRRVSPRGAGE
jgi:ATP-dependent RNA helicase RhlE